MDLGKPGFDGSGARSVSGSREARLNGCRGRARLQPCRL